jgi:hypothetical protein
MSNIAEDKISLRGVSISRESLLEKFGVDLNDTEWLIFKSNLQKSWNEEEAELRKLVFGHIKRSFENMDYKLKIEDTKLIFKNKNS